MLLPFPYSHINNVAANTNKTFAFIRRNKRGCRTSARSAAYQGLVRLILEYVCVAWDPCNSKHIQQLEKVQRRATRFATRNYNDRHSGSVAKMIEDLYLEPLQTRRLKIRLVLLYNMKHAVVAGRTTPVYKWLKDQRQQHLPVTANPD